MLALLTASAASALDFTAQGEYLGSSDCRRCHERFYELWSTSHHGKAMEAFSASLAATLEPMKQPIRVGDDTFIVEFDDQGGVLRGTSADGTEQTWRLRHSFGGRNVRYFLIPMEKGRLQVAPLAYYVHQRRWYDTTASMTREFRDGGPEDEALHWTDRMLTFNTSCHDCHVSQLEKNYNPADDSYTTTWKEPGINCETCHGPAEAHVREAEKAEAAGTELSPDKLMLLRFHEDLDLAQRDATCGPCHAKGGMITYEFTPGELFFDHYDLTSYEDRDFWPDGRDLGENYTQTAWMANPCAASGQLECIHCHTSSGRFRFADDPSRSCLPCHEKRVQNIRTHSHHSAKTGVSCIDCHMPTTAQAFMSRSDHTFRPPSPAATLEFGSPNACNLCHHDREAIQGDYQGHSRADAEWADRRVKKWFGEDSGAPVLKTGRMVQACRQGDWDRLPEITAYLDDPSCDPAAAVAILRLLENCPDPAKWPAIRKQLNHRHEWVRSAAAAALRYDTAPEATRALIEATDDRFRIVRIRAASSLIGRDLSAHSDAERGQVAKAHAEYWTSLTIGPDRWGTHYNQGIYFDRMGQPEKALAAYTRSIELRDDIIAPLINASMVYARAGDTTNAYALLERALEAEPGHAAVNFNMALLEAELGCLDRAEAHLRTALETDPDMAQAAYNLGVLLARDNRPEGLEWLQKAALAVPESWDYTSSCLFFLDKAGRAGETEAMLLQLLGTGRASAQAYFLLADRYVREGRTAEALEICRKARLNKHLSMEARRYAAQMEQRLRGTAQP